MKKGFTLIELLAVLLILAVIALIAVPIVLNIIKDSKNNANLMSAKMYVEAANKSIMNYSLNTKFPDTTCNILDGGNLSCEGIDKEIEIGISNGSQIKSGGIVTIENREVKEIFGLIVDDIVYDYKNGSIGKVKKYKIDFDTTGGSTIASQEVLENRKIVMPSNPTKEGYTFVEWRLSGETYDFDTPVTKNITLKARWRSETSYTLVTGQNFNAKIKTLVSGSGNYSTNDTSVKSIKFYSSGNLPEGYTKDDLDDFNKVDLSSDNKKTIMAYHLGDGNVIIYSDGIIKANSNSNNMFQNLKALETIDFEELDTSTATTMAQMFQNAILIEKLDLSGFNIENVSNVSYMFNGCSNLTNINLSGFKTSSALKNVSYMFIGCSNLTSLIFPDTFDTSEVTTMQGMFANCSKLEEVDLSSFNTLKVKNMSQMFINCQSLKEVNLSNFYTEELTTTGSMFDSCKNLNSVDLSNLDTSRVTSSYKMFYGCQNLKVLDLRNAELSGITEFRYIFVKNTAAIYLKDTQTNRDFMSTNYPSYTPTYIAPSTNEG